jgi:hypothetical protein
MPAAVLGRRTAARLERLQSAPEVSELIAVGRVLTDVDPSRKTRALELARRVLEQAIEMAPGDPSARYNYGRVLRQGNIEAALGAWTKALALQPGDDLAMQIHTQIGKAKEDLSDMPAAEQAYKTAFEINRRLPARVPEAALEYVRFLHLQARTRDAEAVLNEVVGWNPWSPLWLPWHSFSQRSRKASLLPTAPAGWRPRPKRRAAKIVARMRSGCIEKRYRCGRAGRTDGGAWAHCSTTAMCTRKPRPLFGRPSRSGRISAPRG